MNKIESEFVGLCEGAADNAFFQKLCEVRGLAKFSFPFPPRGNDADTQVAAKFSGRDSFGNMLRALNALFETQPERKDDISGVMIAADAHDSADATFRHVCKQIRDAGKFGVPNAISEVATSAEAPPLAVVLVPGKGMAGGLETLCVDDLVTRHSDEADCLRQYIDCCPSAPGSWGAEKADKVRFQCLVAVTYPANPTRGVVHCFSRFGSVPPAVDLSSSSFDAVSDELRVLSDKFRQLRKP